MHGRAPASRSCSQWIHCDETSVSDEKCDKMYVCVAMSATGPSADVFVEDMHTFLYSA